MRKYVTLVLLLMAPFAVVSAQEPEKASPSSPAVPADNTVNSVTLPDGLPIKLRLVNPLDSKTAKNEDEIQFSVVNDVVVGGRIILRRGAPATGVVTQTVASRTMGRAGKLNFTIHAIKVENGASVPVRAYNRTSGENRTGEMVDLMIQSPIVAAPFLLLIHGTNTIFPRGTEIMAFVNGNLPLRFASSTGSENSR